MSEGHVLPEWGIKLRNTQDRMVPLINEHHRDIDEMKQQIQHLEAMIGQAHLFLQQMQSTIGGIQVAIMTKTREVDRGD